MGRVSTDDQGRLRLPERLRQEYGNDYRLIPFHGALRLIPVLENPVEDLRERTRPLRESDETVQELKQEVREYLMDAAG